MTANPLELRGRHRVNNTNPEADLEADGWGNVMANRRHKRPHVHVRYQEHEVVLAIPDGEILEGSIPGSKLKLALAWMEIHRDELLADWDLAAIGQQPYKIEPLK